MNEDKICQLNSDIELTVLMPCLNESTTIGACIDEAAGFLRDNGIRGEILICDNGSTDGSADIARARGARVVCCPHRGYGNALRFGLSNAKGRYIVMGDCDLSYPFSKIDDMYALLRQGADMVIGNRFFSGAPAREAMPFSHRIGVPVLSLIGRMRFNCDVQDFHCGLRGISKACLDRLSFETEGMEFATEMIAKGARAGVTIVQTPVILRPDGRGAKSKLRTVRDGFRHLWFIIKGVK